MVNDLPRLFVSLFRRWPRQPNIYQLECHSARRVVRIILLFGARRIFVLLHRHFYADVFHHSLPQCLSTVFCNRLQRCAVAQRCLSSDVFRPDSLLIFCYEPDDFVRSSLHNFCIDRCDIRLTKTVLYYTPVRHCVRVRISLATYNPFPNTTIHTVRRFDVLSSLPLLSPYTTRGLTQHYIFSLHSLTQPVVASLMNFLSYYLTVDGNVEITSNSSTVLRELERLYPDVFRLKRTVKSLLFLCRTAVRKLVPPGYYYLIRRLPSLQLDVPRELNELLREVKS